MSEDRYKQALGNLDSDTRTCFKHLEHQIKESKAAPLKAFQELEKNVLKALARMEQRDKLWVKSMETIGKLEDEYREQTPNFLEQMYNKYCQDFENIGKQYLDAMDECGKRYQKRFEQIVGDVEEVKKATYEIYDEMNKVIKIQKSDLKGILQHQN